MSEEDGFTEAFTTARYEGQIAVILPSGSVRTVRKAKHIPECTHTPVGDAHDRGTISLPNRKSRISALCRAIREEPLG